MRPFLLRSLLALVFFTASTTLVQAQLTSFGSNALREPLNRYRFTAYGYYDIIREAGLGIQYQFGPGFSLDCSLFSVRPNATVKRIIRETDYFDFRGAGIGLKARYHFSRRSNWYVGIGFSMEYLEHDALEVEYGEGDYEPYHTMDKCYGYASNISATFGTKGVIQRICLEPYFVLGFANASLQRTIYSSTGRYSNPYNNATFPFTIYSNDIFFNLSIGIKMGLAFKPNKKQAAIDRKFDNTFIPAYTVQYNRIAAMPSERIRASRSLRRANGAIRSANRRFLKMYKRNYSDTSYLYQKLDQYIRNIDGMINAENAPEPY